MAQAQNRTRNLPSALKNQPRFCRLQETAVVPAPYTGFGAGNKWMCCSGPARSGQLPAVLDNVPLHGHEIQTAIQGYVLLSATKNTGHH